MDILEIKQEIRDFFSKSFRIQEINDTDNVFATGIVHSLFFIQLLVFIEKKFKVELQQGEFDVDKLTNINAISELVASKLSVESIN